MIRKERTPRGRDTSRAEVGEAGPVTTAATKAWTLSNISQAEVEIPLAEWLVRGLDPRSIQKKRIFGSEYLIK
jgi:hypothetical protein